MEGILSYRKKFEDELVELFGQAVNYDEFACREYGGKRTCGHHLSIYVPADIWKALHRNVQKWTKNKVFTAVEFNWGPCKGVVAEPGTTAFGSMRDAPRYVTLRAELLP